MTEKCCPNSDDTLNPKDSTLGKNMHNHITSERKRLTVVRKMGKEGCLGGSVG